MKDFSQITLVSVTGLSDTQRAVYALSLSLRQMPGARAVLCSPQAPAHLPDGIEHRRIAPLNYHEYSWFMMYALWRVVETEFALIVQDDGWVLDTANWSDDFLEYDYVGPTAHVGRIDAKEGTRWVTHYTWSGELDKPGQAVMPVINGGFCLRSRRMMRALIDHPEIRMTIPAPDKIAGDALEVEWTNCALNEDVQLTCVLRPELEAVGLRFAPLEMCLRFGIEHAGPVHRDVNMMSLFGHHCRWRRLVSIDPPTVQYRTKRSIAERAFREMDIARMLEARGYRVQFLPEDA
ncbi:DUF5672 family protein [Caballeronia sp. Lep1P3]|uniref:DUF5672 family protein n=1 Tax=Caballeronia sp. Lep1P3 TaxID=2878150 RepID=UPI001FD26F45|nr:DUF5672 family protein [Caballeronia sp. Lep1P3]